MPRTIITEVPSGPSDVITDWVATGQSSNVSATPTQVVAKVAGKRHYISTIVISSLVDNVITIQDDTGTPNVAIDELYIAAKNTIPIAFTPGSELKMGADNQDIDIVGTVSGSVSWTATGFTK